jgi:hypothetical protein
MVDPSRSVGQHALAGSLGSGRSASHDDALVTLGFEFAPQIPKGEITLNRPLILFSTVLALAACQANTTASEVDPLTAAVSGKTLVSEGGEFQVGSNGALSGAIGPNRDTAVAGAWAIRDGQWCRTLTEPARLAGTACQAMTLNGDGTVTIDGVNGPVVYAIR